jgi:hypothetical protein
MEDAIKTGLNGPADGPPGSTDPVPGLRTVVSGPAADSGTVPAATGSASDLPDTLEYQSGEYRPGDSLPGEYLPSEYLPGEHQPSAYPRGAYLSVAHLPGRVTDWAVRRGMAPNSATSICLVLGICAAAWFSGGTRPDDAKAAVALVGSYVAGWAAQLLISPLAGIRAGVPVAGVPVADGTAAWAAGERAATADRLASLTGQVCEYAVYAGLALGARGAHWRGAWELATAAMILLSVRQTIWACGDPVGSGARSRQILSGSSERMLAPAGIGRLALIAVVASIWGARPALVALLAWGIAATGYAVTSRPTADQADGMVTRCRDDGEIARWLGRMVRGNLAALPPALAGLAATATLALLGLQNLPGLLAFTPVVAMLLAAPGSAAPHTGPADWLVPALLQAGQFLYLAALGFCCGVPAPVTFALCAVIALRSAMLTSSWRTGQGGPLELGSGLGWEGRMLVTGLGVLIGLATFAYAALTAYLGVLICSKVMTSRRGVSR